MGAIRAFSPHVRWTTTELSLVARLYPSATRDELLEALPGRSIQTIQCKANELGLKRMKRPSKTAEEARKAKREHMASRRLADPEGVRKYQREYHHRNGERNREKMRDYAARRFFWSRANKLRSANSATYSELARLWKAQRGLCDLTGDRLTRENSELDHILPKSRGGDDRLSNLRWVTKKVNRAKRDLTDAEFFAMCSNVMRWIGQRIQIAREAGL